MTQIWGEMTGVSRSLFFSKRSVLTNTLCYQSWERCCGSMDIPDVKAAEPAREPGEPGSKVMLLRLVPRCCVSCSW